MKADELMKPRFEIIADYPNNEFGQIGTILDRDWASYPYGEEYEPEWKISDYPHIFRPMNWWEDRTVDQMPKKLICKAVKESNIVEIESWDMDTLTGWIDKKNWTCCSLRSFKPELGYFPID